MVSPGLFLTGVPCRDAGAVSWSGSMETVTSSVVIVGSDLIEALSRIFGEPADGCRRDFFKYAVTFCNGKACFKIHLNTYLLLCCSDYESRNSILRHCNKIDVTVDLLAQSISDPQIKRQGLVISNSYAL